MPAATNPVPLILWIHGGAWRAGDKAPCPARFLLADGFAVAPVNYRLSQHATFPAQLEDVKTALRWLRAHARDYGLDPDRFGVWGASAGGHLAALLGTTGDVPESDPGEPAGVSSRVQAVCDWFGPTDFLQMNRFPGAMDHDAPDSPESLLIGGPIREHPDKVRRANPLTYVSADDPPFLIMHGDRDPLVPLHQSQLLADALRAAGVPVRLEVIRGAGHGFGGPAVRDRVRAFFRARLQHP